MDDPNILPVDLLQNVKPIKCPIVDCEQLTQHHCTGWILGIVTLLNLIRPFWFHVQSNLFLFLYIQLLVESPL